MQESLKFSDLPHDVSQYIFWDWLDLCSRLQFSMVNKKWHKHYKAEHAEHNDKQKKIKQEDEKIIIIQKQVLNILKTSINPLFFTIAYEKVPDEKFFTGLFISAHIANFLKNNNKNPYSAALFLYCVKNSSNSKAWQKNLLAKNNNGETAVHIFAKFGNFTAIKDTLLILLGDNSLTLNSILYNTKGETVFALLYKINPYLAYRLVFDNLFKADYTKNELSTNALTKEQLHQAENFLGINLKQDFSEIFSKTREAKKKIDAIENAIEPLKKSPNPTQNLLLKNKNMLASFMLIPSACCVFLLPENPIAYMPFATLLLLVSIFYFVPKHCKRKISSIEANTFTSTNTSEDNIAIDIEALLQNDAYILPTKSSQASEVAIQNTPKNVKQKIKIS